MNKFFKALPIFALIPTTGLVFSKIQNTNNYVDDIHLMNKNKNTKQSNSATIYGTRDSLLEIRWEVENKKLFVDANSIISSSKYQFVENYDEIEIGISYNDYKMNYKISDKEYKVVIEEKRFTISIREFDLGKLEKIDFNKKMKLWFHFDIKWNDGKTEHFKGELYNIPDKKPIIVDAKLNSGSTTINGKIISDDNHFEIIGGKITATPIDGGTMLPGYLNTSSKTFYIDNLLPNTKYIVSMQLNFKDRENNVMQTQIYRREILTKKETKGLSSAIFLSSTETYAQFAINSTSNNLLDLKIDGYENKEFTKFNFEEISTFSNNNGIYTHIIKIKKENNDDLLEGNKYKIRFKDSYNTSQYISFETKVKPTLEVDASFSEIIVIPEIEDVRFIYEFRKPFNSKNDTDPTQELEVKIYEGNNPNSNPILSKNDLISNQDDYGITFIEGLNSFKLSKISDGMKLRSSTEYFMKIKYTWNFSSSNQSSIEKEIKFKTKSNENYLEWFKIDTKSNSVKLVFHYQINNNDKLKYDVSIMNNSTGESKSAILDDENKLISDVYNIVNIDGLSSSNSYSLILNVNDNSNINSIYTYGFETDSNISNVTLRTWQFALVITGSILLSSLTTWFSFYQYRKFIDKKKKITKKENKTI